MCAARSSQAQSPMSSKPRLQFYTDQERYDLIVTYIIRSNGRWRNFTDFGRWLLDLGLAELKKQEMRAIVDGKVVDKPAGEHWEPAPDPSAIRPGRGS